MAGIMERPLGTASEPEGGQKSFCMSTIMRVAVLGLKSGIVVVMSGVA